MEEDVKIRLGKAYGLFHKIGKIWKSKSINTDTKLHLFNSIILPTATYASETWKSSKKSGTETRSFPTKIPKKNFKYKLSYPDHKRRSPHQKPPRNDNLAQTTLRRSHPENSNPPTSQNSNGLDL